MEYLISNQDFDTKYLNFIKKKISHKNSTSWLKQQLIKKDNKTANFLSKIPQNYKSYIKSRFWRNRKNQFLKDYGRKCMICGSSYQISVHHLFYGNYGFEKDEDLTTLCWSCHEDYHKEYGVSGRCNKSFLEFCVSRVNNPPQNC